MSAPALMTPALYNKRPSPTVGAGGPVGARALFLGDVGSLNSRLIEAKSADRTASLGEESCSQQL